MSKELTTDTAYNKLITDLQAAFVTGEAANLIRYHRFGELFAEFCTGIDSRKYGTRTVDTLVDDLKNNGLLASLSDPKRFLYWAKNLYDTYPDQKKLKELAGKGFTMSHAKLLFAIEPELLQSVSDQMLDDKGAMVSTRELTDIIRGMSKDRAFEKLVEVVGETPTPAVNQTVEQATAPAAAAPSDDAPAAPAGKAAKPEKSSKAPKDDSGPINALKVIKGLSKTSDKLLTGLADGFLAIKAADKTGFDSDKAQKNFSKMAGDLRDSLSRMQEPIAELVKELEAFGSSD
jgi:hypothetical protein